MCLTYALMYMLDFSSKNICLFIDIPHPATDNAWKQEIWSRFIKFRFWHEIVVVFFYREPHRTAQQTVVQTVKESISKHGIDTQRSVYGVSHWKKWKHAIFLNTNLIHMFNLLCQSQMLADMCVIDIFRKSSQCENACRRSRWWNCSNKKDHSSDQGALSPGGDRLCLRVKHTSSQIFLLHSSLWK